MNDTVDFQEIQEIQEIQEFWYNWIYNIMIDIYVSIMIVFVIPFAISAIWVWCCTPIVRSPEEYWANEYWKQRHSRDKFIETHKKDLQKSIDYIKSLEADLKKYKAKYKKYSSYPCTRANVKNLDRWQIMIDEMEHSMKYNIEFIDRHDRFVQNFIDNMDYCIYIMNNSYG